MPHLTIEHTSNLKPNLDTSLLLERLHVSLKEVPDLDMNRLKSRIFSTEKVISGEKTFEIKMVHVTLAVLSGRTPELKKHYGEVLFSELLNFATASLPSDTSLTVEVREMDKNFYFKN